MELSTQGCLKFEYPNGQQYLLPQEWYDWFVNKPLACSDPLVSRVIERMRDRAEAGMIKFGTSMERPDVSTIEWLRSAQEEALDLAVYLERVITDLQ